MNPSVTRSHIAARNVRPFDMQDVSAFADLRDIGIGIDSADLKQMIAGIGFDSLEGTVTNGSIATPVQFLQAWLPGFVKVVTAARKIDDFVGITTAGSWEEEEVIQGIMELTGTSVPYGDYSNIPLSSWNINFERRSVVRFEEGMQVGTLEEARSARIRINTAQEKRKASALALEIQRNKIGFYGYNNGANRTYGLLNDPSLPAYVTVNEGASGHTEWSNKTFLEITSDIRTAMAALRIQSQDLIDPESTPVTMGLATGVIDSLSVMNDLGNKSVRAWLNETYPKVRVISAPELNGANGGANVMYLYAENFGEESTDDGAVMIQVVPAKFQTLGVEKRAKTYLESYSNATAGVMVKRPWAVYRATGL